MKNATSRNLIRTALLAVFMCALPAVAGEDVYGLGNGQDGAFNSSGSINFYARVSAQASAGTNSVTIASNPGIGVNDLVMLLQTTGISPEPPSGGPDSIDLSNSPVGRWELARVSSLAGGGNTLILDAPLLNTYAATGAQVILVPEYTSVTLGSANLTPRTSWDGSTGGVLAFLSQGPVRIDGSLTATSRGFRGGQAVMDVPTANSCTGLDQPAPSGAQKGEGIAMLRYGLSHTGRGRVANGAGGGVCLKSGGGGGGSAGAGGSGGFSQDGSRAVGGDGGASLFFSPVSRLLLGGGGAPGHITGGSSAAGGQGGGIVFMRGGSLLGAGTLIADGFLSANVSTGDAAGGGGGGGTLYLRFAGRADCDTSRVHAWGGRGGNTNAVSGPGGGGGGGRILFQACGGGNCVLPGSSVAGGAVGTSSATFDSYGAQPGADGLLTILPGCYSPLSTPVVVTPANGSSTNDATPDYTGTLMQPYPPGTEVIIYVDNVEVGRVVPDALGNWSFTQPTNLADGSHTVYAVAINDAQGLQSSPSNMNTFTVDSTPPAVPVVVTPANGAITNSLPTYSGTADPGSTVTVIVDGTVVGMTTANAAGNWSFPQPAALAEGTHTVRARASDAAGNTSGDSNTNTFTVDTTPPPPPTVINPPDGSVTNNNRPTYSGTADPGSIVTVIVDGVAVGTTTANAGGSWSFPQPAALADGTHTVKATARDAVGNTSGDSNTNTFTVDTLPPSAPVVVTPADGTITNNNRPTYSGTADPGSIVTVIVDGVAVGMTTADAGGNWSFPQPAALAEGTHTVRARASDAAGNTSGDSNTNTFTVDITPPPAPVVVTPSNGSVTNNNRPTYTGTAAAGSTVTVIVDGNSVGTTTADAGGNWSLAQPTALVDGTYTVKATARDAAGNTSGDSNTNTFTVDTLVPLAPVVTAPANGSVTNNNRPTYTGTAEPGSTVTVIVDGNSVGTTTADAGGNWSFPQPTALAEGTHTVKATARDAAGNVSGDSNTNTFTVDTLAPVAPVVTAPANGSVTNDNTPTYMGTAEPNSTVTVFVDGTPVGNATADGAGNWSFTPVASLADGPHAVKATARDVAGNTSLDSSTNTFTVDTLAPVAPVVTAPANGSITNNNTPTYVGTAEPNSTVTVFVDGTPVGNATADGAGNWSLPQPAALADGTHTVTARARDVAGNTSGDSNTNTFTVDTVAPTAPVVTAPANGSITNDNTPDYNGTAEPNTTVTVIVDGTVVGSTTANGAGSWSFTQPAALADGTHTVKVTARDAAGNTSPDSNTHSFTVDTTAPVAPVVNTPANGSTISDNTPDYSGTAEPNTTVTVIVDGTVAGTTTANASGAWSFTPTAGLTNGLHTVKATARDAAGNTSPDSNTHSFTVDTDVPDAPVVLTPANGSISNNNRPVYSGTAEANSTVTVYVDGASVGTTTANVSGAWSLTQPAALAEGTHTVKATARDAVGNTSPESNINTFTVDTLAPAAPVVVAPANGSLTRDNTPDYSGTAEPNSTVTVIVDGTAVGTTTASGTGAWSFTQPAALADGTHAVKATARDAAGNVSPDSNTHSFTVDTTAPAAPVVNTPVDGSTINDNTPTYSGTAEAGSTVTVIVDGTVAGTTTADASGAWSFTPTVGLTNGSHTVKATAEDAAGNTSPESNTNTFTVDATIPAAPVVITPAHNSITNDTTPDFTGTAEANATVTIFLGSQQIGTTTADAAGNWSFTPTAPLAAGLYDVSALATNALGNTSGRSNLNRFTIDTTPPGAPLITSPVNDSVTNDNTPTIAGTAEPDSTVTVTLNGNAVGTATTNAAGNWSFTPTTPLADGTYTAVVTARDVAGNPSAPSNSVRFVIDTAPPETTIVSGPSGETQNPDAMFDFSSNESGVTYECKLDGGDFAACSDPTTFANVSEGEHTLQVRSRDTAGNVDPTPATATWTYHPPPPPPSDWALLGNGVVGCAASGGDPSSLAMMALGVISALLARRRRQ